MAQGRANDLLTTICLAAEVPIAVAPAMNQQMWFNAATQENIQLLILDEAVSSLDVSIKAQILDLLVELAYRYNLTYLFVSHDLSVVQNIANRVIVMKSGEIVEQGKAKQILTKPKKDYTKSLVEAIPIISRRLLNGGQIAK